MTEGERIAESHDPLRCYELQFTAVVPGYRYNQFQKYFEDMYTLSYPFQDSFHRTKRATFSIPTPLFQLIVFV